MAVALAIVVSDFNEEVTAKMLVRAQETAKRLKANVAAVVHVPGAFEIPLALRRLLGRADVDAGVALAAVVKGETNHDEVVVAQVSRRVMDLMFEFDKPVGFGVIGPGVTWTQAAKRVDYAERAVRAAVEMAEAPKSKSSKG